MNLKKWRNLSIIFCLILGVILHFTYEWSGENKIVALFSAVNESTWEHLKLIFFPMVLFEIIGIFLLGKDQNNYIKGNTIGIISAMIFTIIIFYTYSGIIGSNFAVINIAIFVLAVVLGEICAYKIIESSYSKVESKVYIIITIFLIVSFIIFTYNPPHISLFKDPITGTFGIQDKERIVIE